MPTLVASKYFGLWNGPIDHNASSVINAVADSQFQGVAIDIGDAVFLRSIEPDQLLPGVDYVNSAANALLFYGIAVGGDLDGVYGEVGDDVGEDNNTIDNVAVDGDGVRVCTQGRCIARVRTNGIGAINVGDPLTPANTSLGNLTLASSGDNVIARALQPAALDASASDAQYIAVDVQREYTIP